MYAKKINTPLLSISTLMHLLVDGLCVCCLYLTALSANMPMDIIMAVFVSYNITAFLTQPFTGWCIDQAGNSHWPLIIAVALLAMGVADVYCISSMEAWQNSITAVFSVAIIIGIGNSIFHVWGGKQVVLKNGNDPRALGVFVATGAFGLAIAYSFFSWTLMLSILLTLCVATMAYIFIDAKKGSNEPIETVKAEAVETKGWSISMAVAAWIVIAIAVFVMLRSFVGEWFSSSVDKASLGNAFTDSPSNSKIIAVLLIGALTTAGKMAGGWMMKYAGLTPAFCIMIIGTLLCLVFKGQGNIFCLTGMFLINCTMPVTLFLANHILKGKEALAFGILAAALMPGYLLSQVI